MILTNEKAKETLKTITKELYTKYGLATLSSKDKNMWQYMKEIALKEI